nr:hemopexin repeat-containing protein [Pseudoalteromonas sp. S16_S37]
MEYEDFSQVDAIYTDTTGAIFMFSGGQYVKFSDPQNMKKPDLGYPKLISQSWSEEGQSEALHKTFDCHIDASFQGLDDKTYFFKDDYFVTSDAPQTRRAISDVWGKVRNRLAEGHRVDACFVGKNPLLVNHLSNEGSEESGENGTNPLMQDIVTVFSGDQVFAYQDCIENPELEIVSGYPLEIKDYLLAYMGLNPTDGYRFETDMLAFFEGIDAAFVGHDGKLNLFKGEHTAVLGDMPAQLVVSKTKDIWPNNAKTIANSGADGEFFNVSAALTGLDGRVYLFVDNLYYRFSGSDLSVVDAGFPKPIADDWDGLETIDAAFVMDGKTYLFGQSDEHKQYIRYATNDYRKPDEGYPKAQQETVSHWWNLPDSWTGDDVDVQKQFKGVDAVFNAPDKKTYLFSGRYFTYFDHVNRWWAEPELIADKWPALPDAFHHKIDAALSDKTGKTYLFSAGQYVRFSDAHYCEIDEHYPKSTSLDFAQNALEQGMTPCADFIVTAAMSLIAQEKEVGVTDNEIIHTRLYSYLFSGDRYYRYRSEFNDSPGAEASQWLTTLDADYPKPIDKLKDEPRFKHFNETSSVLFEQDAHWLARLDAAFADMRNVYLFIDNRIEVVSTQNHSQYGPQKHSHLDTSHSRLVNAQYALNLNKIDGVQCALVENGHVYMNHGSSWAQFTSLEGYQLGIKNSAPTLIELLHEEDQSALTTVLEGADGNTYYFKSAEQGDHAYYYDKQLDKGERVTDKWGKVANNIEKRNSIDSALHYGNKTYVFSGGQYVIYDEQVDPFLTPNTPVWTDNTQLGIRSVSDDFGLHSVDIAYTADSITYLLEHPDEAGNRRYAILDHCDGEGMYKAKVDYLNSHDWQMPEYLEDHGWLMPDAILNKSQLQKTTMQSDGFRRRNNRAECHEKEALVFIKGREYVNYDPNTDHWTKPASIADLWGDILECDEQIFDKLQGVYVHPKPRTGPGARGGTPTYFLGEHCFQSLLYDLDQQGVSLTTHREYKDYLGVAKPVFTSIDASFVYKSRYTYLFSGNRYIRYTGDDYCHMDEGYPKFIETDLNKEPGFTKLPDSFATTISHIVKQYTLTSNEHAEQMPSCHGEPAIVTHTVINGIISNGHSTYLFLNHGNNEPDSFLVFSEQGRRTVTLDALAYLPNLFDRTESIDAAVTYQGATYLFSNDKYLRYSNCDYEHPDKGYPKSIAQSLLTDIGKGGQLHADFHCDIDGATVGRDGRLYLFKGKQYVELTMPSIAKVIASDWKIDTDSLTNPLCQSSMGELEGDMSQSVFDGAFVDDLGRLYILKGEQVLRYADTEQLYFEPGFPKHVSEVFKQIPREFQQGVHGAFTFAGHTYLVRNGENMGDIPSQEGIFVRYPTGQYHCLYTPHKDLQYPQTFASRWGRWADYRLQDLALISSFKKLNEKASTEHDLTAMFKHHGGYVDKPFEKIAAMYDWDLEDLTWLKRKNGFLPKLNDEEQFVTLEWLDRVNQIFALAHRLRTSAKSMYQDIYMPRYMASDKVDGELFEVDGVKYHFDRNQAIADKLLTYLTGKYCKDAQAKILKSEIHNRLNILKRDAMVPFILYKDEEISDERDLSEKLLIDVQMSECMETSRVKEAIGAVQLYFHRLFLNLEQVELKGESDNEQVRKALKARWEWFKNYRVWEANRKVFLYPENYIRPELRDTKTELFKRFEEAISQGNLNNDTLNKAFGQYVDSYAQVSNLTIAGGYVYDNPNNSADKEVILFAHTKTQPMTYYYRTATFVDGQTSEVVWKPWQSVNIAIDADRVYPVFIQNKIFIFWTRVEQAQVGAKNSKVEIRANSDDKSLYTPKSNSAIQSVIKFFYSTLNSNQQWSTPQQLNYQKAFKEKVSAHYLSFKHQEGKTSGGLDKIEIQCFSSLENEIFPILEDDQTVDLKKLRDTVIKVNRLAHFEHNHPTLYFKAVSDEGDYYLYAAPAEEESDKFRLKMKRVVPGDKLPAIYLQGMLPFSNDGNDTQKNGFYIIRDYQRSPYYYYMGVQGSKAWSIKGNAHQHIERDITPQMHRTMMLRKASTGHGFNLVYQANGSDAEHTLYYEHNLDVSAFESKDSHGQIKSPQNEQLSHSAFIPVTHYENHTRFEFTPQTNQSVELSNKAADKDFNWINSGISTFETLFPKEDSSRIQQPVALNVPDNSGQNLSWLCFDYKGGSFLCKPTIGNIEVEEAKDLGAWFNSNVAQQAVYNPAADKTYWFDGNAGQGQFVRLSDEELVSNAAPSSAKQTSEYWGRVRQDIRTNIDAALFVPNAVSGKDAVYLFSDKDYLRFTLNEGEQHDLLQADTGYPKILGQDKDVIHLPTEQVSGAFHNGGNNYFVQGKQWGTVDSHGNIAAMPYPLWPQAKMTDEPFDVSKITGVFEYAGKTYLIYEYDRIKEFELLNEPLLDSLESYYTRSNANEINRFKSGFTYKEVVFFNVGSDTQPELYYMNSTALYCGNGSHGNAPLRYRVYDQGPNYNLVQLQGSGWTKEAKVYGEDNAAVSPKIKGFFYYKGFFYIQQGDEYIARDQFNMEEDIELHRQGDLEKLAVDSLENFIHGAEIDATCILERYIVVISGSRVAYYKDFDDIKRSGEQGLSSVSLRQLSDNESEPIKAAVVSKNIQGDGRIYHQGGYTYIDDNELKPYDTNWIPARNQLKANDGKIDAIFAKNNVIYLLTGDYYYRYSNLSELDDLLQKPLTSLSDTDVAADVGYPKRIAQNQDGVYQLSNNRELDLQFAFTSEDDTVYVSGRGSAKLFNRVNSLGQLVNGKPMILHQSIKDALGVTHLGQIKLMYNHGNHTRVFANGKYLDLSNLAGLLPDLSDAKYDILRLSSMTGSEIARKFYSGGVEGLLALPTQLMDETPRFMLDDGNLQTDDTRIIVNAEVVDNDNVPSDSHLEFRHANGIYYWELFYHLPALIAQTLSESQKFEAAKRWYQMIFDPSNASDNWHFLPFVSSDIDAIVSKLAQLKDITALTAATNAFINALVPLNPLFKGQRLTSEQLDAIKQGHTTLSAGVNAHITTALSPFELALAGFNVGDNEIVDYVAQEILPLVRKLPARIASMQTQAAQIRAYLEDPFDPHTIAGLRTIAYRRNIVMGYIDNIIDWGDALFRRYTRESINEARMLYMLAYDMLGKRPDNLGDLVLSNASNYADLHTLGADTDERTRYDVLFDVDGGAVEHSLNFAGRVHESVTNSYFHVPENAHLLKYWDRVEDRLHKIRQCLDINGIKQPLPLFQPPIDPMALVNAVAGGGGVASAIAGLSAAVPYYRFDFMLAKAKELVAQVSQFDGELLGTIEKLEAEQLAQLQQKHEGVILDKSRAAIEARLEEAKLNKQGLEENLERAKFQKAEYDSWLTHKPGVSVGDFIDDDNGWLASEVKQLESFDEAGDMLYLSVGLEGAASALEAIGEIKFGSPCTLGTIVHLGKIAAAVASVGAKIAQTRSEILSYNAESYAVVAQHELSMRDWQMQRTTTEHEENELKLQIQGSDENIKSIENELLVHDQEVKHNAQVADFLQSKFTNAALYAWMKGRLMKAHDRAFKLAHDYAKAAEMAYRFERSITDAARNHIQGMHRYWDNSKLGHQSANQLSVDLHELEKAHLDTHQRDHEVTKTISLAQWDPIALMTLKHKRLCQFKLTEEMFAYDFPSHYCRQIKAVKVQIEAGDGTTVNAILTQQSHKTVMEPDVNAVKHLLSPEGTVPLSIRSNWRPNQHVAVSQLDQYTQQSSGVFELNFADSRYLPFEGTGAVSNWQLEIPGAQSNFDINQIKDVKIELDYTAKNAGNEYANQVRALLKPYTKAVYLDIAQLFANDFYDLVHQQTEELTLNVSKARLPGMHGDKIDAIYTYMETENDEQVNLTLNGDDTLILRNKGILLTNSVSVAKDGARWTLTPQGDVSKLEKLGLIVVYKAKV